MRRNKELLIRRAEYIQNYVRERPNVKLTVLIYELEQTLFLCESTIWLDLRKDIEQLKQSINN